MKKRYLQPQTEFIGSYGNFVLQNTLTTEITDDPAIEIPESNEGFFDELDYAGNGGNNSYKWDRF